MILNCLGCHHSYDVSKYKPGQRLRCACGQILVVPDSGYRPQVVRTFHCAACGGNLEKGAKTCPFCGALVDLSAARLTVYCSACFAMSREGAKFCSGCGAPLTAKLDTPNLVDKLCPRCGVQMREREIQSHKTVECPICLGMFVEVDTFEQLIRKQEERIGEVVREGGAEKSALNAQVVTYIKCPVCKGVMNRMNYGRISGVIVDFCRRHGYWLDDGELGKIARWVATGGLKEKYELEKEEAAEAARRARFDKMATENEARRESVGYMSNMSGRELGRSTFSLLDFISSLFD
jgi:Zn-finger nucleic acid-binding protein